MMMNNDWNSLQGYEYKGYNFTFGIYNSKNSYVFIKITKNGEQLTLKKYYSKVDFSLYDQLLKEAKEVVDFITFQVDCELMEREAEKEEDEVENEFLNELTSLTDELNSNNQDTHDWVIPPYEKNKDGDLVEIEESKENKNDSVSDWFNSTDLNRYL